MTHQGLVSVLDAEEPQPEVTSNRRASPGIQETVKMTGN